MSVPVFDMSWLQLLLVVGLLVSAAYYVVTVLSAREQFRRPAADPPAGDLPPVTVLKPLKGLDAELYENLASLCRQDYERFQLIFGVADAADPAVPVVHRLQAEYPDLDLELVVNPRVYGTNYKVSNLHNMYRRARHDVLVIADSDIRVPRDHLRRVVGRLADRRVGLVTCLYRAVSTGGLPSAVESLSINTDFCGMIMAARTIERPRYAFGATIAMRRAVLDEVGGFLPLANHLADDYQLGHRVAERGYELVLSDQLVDTVIAVGTWRRLWEHQLRWARTYRICRPGGYFGSILTHGTLWAMLNLLYNDFSRGSWLVAAGVIGLRHAAAAALCWRYLRTDTRPHELLLLTAKDLFVSVVWFMAFLGDTVRWSGRHFRVLPGGEMIDLAPRAAAAQAGWHPDVISALPEGEPTAPRVS